MLENDNQEKIDELYDRCIELEHIRYKSQDKLEEIIECLLHSNITIEEMDKISKIIGGLVWQKGKKNYLTN